MTEYERLVQQQQQGIATLQAKYEAANAQVERLVAAIAAGASEFEVVRLAFSAAKAERDALAKQIAEWERPSALDIDEEVISSYRKKVQNLRIVLSEEKSRMEALPALRSLIDRVRVRRKPTGARGVNIDLTGKLAGILALANGDQSAVCVIAGAREGIRPPSGAACCAAQQRTQRVP